MLITGMLDDAHLFKAWFLHRVTCETQL